MTIEKICGCSATELMAMSDEDLKKWAEPLLPITRPELAPKPTPKEHHKRATFNTIKEDKRQQALAILAKFGRTDIKL